MAIAATEIAWSTPSRVTLRHPLWRGMPGLLLSGGIWSSWELWQSMRRRTVYLTLVAEIPTRTSGSESRWTSTPSAAHPCSTPARVTLRHPLGRGSVAWLLRGGIWSSWKLRRIETVRTVYLPVVTGLRASRRDHESPWTSTGVRSAVGIKERPGEAGSITGTPGGPLDAADGFLGKTGLVRRDRPRQGDYRQRYGAVESAHSVSGNDTLARRDAVR